MMLVRTRVGPSPIEGVGLFAMEPIAGGTRVWRLDESVDVRMRESLISFIAKENPCFLEFVVRYAYEDDALGKIISLDDSRFMNHADDPNTAYDRWYGWATRDISVGEEITCDYAACGVAMLDAGPTEKRNSEKC